LQKKKKIRRKKEREKEKEKMQNKSLFLLSFQGKFGILPVRCTLLCMLPFWQRQWHQHNSARHQFCSAKR
jgi:hypothetical protein